MVRVRSITPLLALLALGSACEKKQDSTTTTSASQPVATTGVTANPEARTAPVATAPPAPGKAANAPAVIWKDVGLATPESVLHDSVSDVYLVSNINGQPLDIDGNGFVSKLSPDGKVENLKWIEGGKNKVTLNAPKGLAFLGDVLYVADVDTVRLFDRKTGAPQGEVKIAGATFLNDVVATSDGRILVSDTGMKAGAKGLEPSGTDAVYQIDKAKKVTPIAKGKELANPNGLLAVGDKIWVSSFGSVGELYALDAKGKKTDAQKISKGSLDGIVGLQGGELLVASWDASAIYRGKPGGDFSALVEDVKSPADIGYDNKRARILVPLFEKSEVHAYDLK
jgi:hypothetical protein